MVGRDVLIDIELREGPVDVVPVRPFPAVAGAECLFLGRTRLETHGSRGALTRLSYHAYEPMVRRVLAELAELAADRYGCQVVRIHHATGAVPPGEASVVVQVVCGHRGPAFEACRFLIDELKQRAPIWKQEQWADGTTWSEGDPGQHGGSRRLKGCMLMLKIVDMVYWLGLVAWVSALAAVAVAATGVFSTLPDLGMRVVDIPFESLDEHGRYAAGRVMDPIFTFVDLVQMGCALTVGVTLIVQLAGRRPTRTIPNAIRTFGIATAATLLAWRVGVIAPEMNVELRRYWSAAEAGDMEAARAHREAFDADHPTASRLYQGTLLVLVVAVGASAVAVPPATVPRRETRRP